MSTITQDNRTATTLTADSRTTAATITQDTRVNSGISWGSNVNTWATETNTWASIVGNFTLDART